MSRFTAPPLLVLGLGVALAGCPIPQPLPEYSATGITPPRILVDELLAPGNGDFDGAVTLIPANCTSTVPTRDLAARFVDTNTVESVEGRWFVNYDFRDAPWNEVKGSSVILPNQDTTNIVRTVPSWRFNPYLYPPPYGTPPLVGPPYPDAGILRVVELVVSNGFDPGVVGTFPAANRAPKPSFETQVYRWVFLTVPASTAVPCP